MAIKKHDFIEIDYTGKLEDGTVFDTTEESVAKENDIHNSKTEYGSIVICLGEHQLIKGLDEKIEGNDIGKYTFNLTPEEAFGKRDAKYLQLISTAKFKKEGITPMPGLQVNIDGVIGIVKTVTGGRTIIDFNHPLAGKAVVYDIKINKLITDTEQKVKAFVEVALHQKDFKVKKEGEKFTVELKQEIPKEIKGKLEEKFREVTKAKEVIFTHKK